MRNTLLLSATTALPNRHHYHNRASNSHHILQTRPLPRPVVKKPLRRQNLDIWPLAPNLVLQLRKRPLPSLRKRPIHALRFNEPDGGHSTGGSNLGVAVAAARWKAEIEPLKELGVKLGAPAVTGAESGWQWLENFFKECGGGCNPDFIPVHWYGNFEGMMSHVGQVTTKWPNMTVWVTEYGYPNQGMEET
ncbi:Glycoside hydrolase family 128 protein [Pyrenophora tritici-repentis]|nr:Glycoside hydrolase family 128 protein [Pyrenophora tritici-repentis]